MIFLTWPLFCAGIAALFTMVGGAIPLAHRKLSRSVLTILIAFSGGVLLSAALNHMVVESFAIIGGQSMLAVSFGFLLLYGIEKITMIHACQEEGCDAHRFGGLALVGIGFHSFLDGFSITVSMKLDVRLGAIVALAVLLHRLPTGVCIATVMLANHFPSAKAWFTLSLIAGLLVAGALAGLLSALSGIAAERFLSIAIGISAGTFIYIATGDLMPMAHANVRDYRVPLAFAVGFLGTMGTAFIHV
jgi:ZIP family zinc transporter/zinc and cadmium transporter